MKRPLAALGVLLVAGGMGGCHQRAPEPPLPVIGMVPDFSLLDEQGKPIRLADLRGRVWVADFIFTHCAGPCPKMSKRMSDLQGFVGGARGAALVSFSVDPTRDTPEVLREYGRRYGARPQVWRFVTGDEKTIYDLAIKGFKLTVEAETPSAPIMHSTQFMLVDGRGRIRGAFNGEDAEAIERLKAAIQRLLAEPD